MLTIRINPAIFDTEPFKSYTERERRMMVYHLDEPGFNVTNVPVMPDPRPAKLIGDQPFVAGQSRNRDLFVTMTGTMLDEDTLNFIPVGSGTLRAMLAASVRMGKIIVTNHNGRDLVPDDFFNGNWA